MLFLEENLAAYQGFSVYIVFTILQLFYSAYISPSILHMTVATVKFLGIKTMAPSYQNMVQECIAFGSKWAH